MISLEALPGFIAWGRHLDELLRRPEPLWVHGAGGSGVSAVVQELARRRGCQALDDADLLPPITLQAWLQEHPNGILGGHAEPEAFGLRNCLPLRLWTVEEAPDALGPCLEALALELGLPLPLPSALATLPCPGNLLELRNRVLRWKLLGQAPENTSRPQLPLETDDVATNLHLLERFLLHRALRRSYGNRTEAAQRLGVSRRQLYLLIERHGDPMRGAGPVAPPPKRLKKRE